MDNTEYRIKSEEEVNTYLAQLRYALDAGAELNFQIERKVDEDSRGIIREIRIWKSYNFCNVISFC